MSWQKTKISEFLIERKDRFKPDKANELGLPRIEKIDFSGTIYINNFKPTKTGMILVKNGDLVISGINVEKGALAIYKGDTDALATIHYSAYTYDEDRIDIDFLKWYLQSNIFRNILKGQVKGGIKTEIKSKTFLNLEIILPDLTTQKQIASRLNKLAWDIKNLDFTCFCNKELIISLRQSLLNQAITGVLSIQKPNEYVNIISKSDIDNIPFTIPSNWKWLKLKDILDENKDITYGIVKMGLEPSDGVCALRCSDIQYRYIKRDGIRFVTKEVSNQYSRTILTGNGHEILMNIRGTLGGCALVPPEMAGYNIAREIALIPLNNKINSRYILDVLSSPYIQQTTFANLRGIAYKGLNLSLLRDFLIPVPPKEEQERIVRKVDELMQLCDKLENENNNAQKASSDLLQAIMQKYFTQKESSNEIIDLNFKRAVLSAKIINEMHEEKYFGAVKLEKILYLCETHLGVTLNGKYKKEAAGPYDAKSRYEVEDILKIKKWFDVQKVTNGSVEITKYLPLENCHEIKTLYNDVFAGSLSKIDKLMDLFKGKNSDFCESIATLYAVWKNRLNNNLTCSNSELIADFKMWSKSKERFYDSDLLDRILFMRRKGLTPDSNIKK